MFSGLFKSILRNDYINQLLIVFLSEFHFLILFAETSNRLSLLKDSVNSYFKTQPSVGTNFGSDLVSTNPSSPFIVLRKHYPGHKVAKWFIKVIE